MAKERFYLPSQLAKAAGVTAQCIRVWEATGKIPPSVRTMGGHRRYTQEHLDIIKTSMAPKPPGAGA